MLVFSHFIAIERYKATVLGADDNDDMLPVEMLDGV